MKHEGFNRHRLKSNPLERIYAAHWEVESKRNLSYILDSINGDERYTQRDAQVAATIIQWLGSPVGQCFVRDVREEYEKLGVSNV